MAKDTVPLEDASDTELQTAARYYGADEAGLMNEVEASKLTERGRARLRQFLTQRAGVESIPQIKD